MAGAELTDAPPNLKTLINSVIYFCESKLVVQNLFLTIRCAGLRYLILATNVMISVIRGHFQKNDFCR
jgi:hypothetical protein